MIKIKDDNIEITKDNKTYKGKYMYNGLNLHLSSLKEEDLKVLTENKDKIIKYLEKEKNNGNNI